MVTTHGSPSDNRAFKNFLGDLKNQGGFVWPPEKARQLENKNRKGHDPVECLEGRGIGTEGLDEDDIEEFHTMAHEDEREVG